MANAAYDPVGALGGLFAPAYIHGNPQSEAAVGQWNAAHLVSPPPPGPLPSAAAAAPAAPAAPAVNSRDAIAQQMMQQQMMQQQMMQQQIPVWDQAWNTQQVNGA
jgi:hypothetical protein